MNKELSPLEALKELKKRYGKSFSIQDDNRMRIVETALKDYEHRLALAKEYKDVNNVAKRLKALEIIKEKLVDIEVLKYALQNNYDCDYYNATMDKLTDRYLTKQEYELLKEVSL